MSALNTENQNKKNYVIEGVNEGNAFSDPESKATIIIDEGTELKELSHN